LGGGAVAPPAGPDISPLAYSADDTTPVPFTAATVQTLWRWIQYQDALITALQGAVRALQQPPPAPSPAASVASDGADDTISLHEMDAAIDTLHDDVSDIRLDIALKHEATATHIQQQLQTLSADIQARHAALDQQLQRAAESHAQLSASLAAVQQQLRALPQASPAPPPLPAPPAAAAAPSSALGPASAPAPADCTMDEAVSPAPPPLPAPPAAAAAPSSARGLAPAPALADCAMAEAAGQVPEPPRGRRGGRGRGRGCPPCAPPAGVPPAGVDAGKVLLRGVPASALAALQSGACGALPGLPGPAGAVLRFWRAGDSAPLLAASPPATYNIVLSVSDTQGGALRLAAASLRRDLNLVVAPYLTAAGLALRRERMALFEELRAAGRTPRWRGAADIACAR
jgi:hypothetical protein